MRRCYVCVERRREEAEISGFRGFVLFTRLLGTYPTSVTGTRVNHAVHNVRLLRNGKLHLSAAVITLTLSHVAKAFLSEENFEDGRALFIKLAALYVRLSSSELTGQGLHLREFLLDRLTASDRGLITLV